MNRLTKVDLKDVERRCALEGIVISELIGEGNSFKSITLKDKKDNIIHLAYTGFGVEIFTKKEPEYEEKWTLKGNFKGLEVSEVFDDEYSAKVRRNELENDPKLVITKELVEVNN